MLTRAQFLAFDELCRREDPAFHDSSDYPAILSHWCATPNVRPPNMPDSVWTLLSENLTDILVSAKGGVSESEDEDELPLGFPEGYRYHAGHVGEGAFTFIDLFAGIGGFHLAMEAVGGHCVFASEWDRFAQETYWHNFGLMPFGDIRKIRAKDIPDHDVLCAGFPCQPFSLAGVSKKNSLGRKHGFEDKTQGTLFFDVCRIIKAKRPKAFFLENVKNLLSHNKGRTFQVIRECLDELGYVWAYQIVDGAKWVPQHRERIFIVGFDKACFPDLTPADILIPTTPLTGQKQVKLREILHQDLPDAQRYTLRDATWATLLRHKAHHEQAGNGFGYGIHRFPLGDDEVTRTISARYHKDGAEILIEQPGQNPRRLTIEEAMQLQGYDPRRFRFPVSMTQAYHQIGNSVVVPAVTATASCIAKLLGQNHDAR